MRRSGHTILSCILAVLLCLSFVPTPALAEATSSNIPAFREDCFTRSSHLGCTHLFELSSRLVLETVDTATIRARLEGLGFTGVSANAYGSQKVLNVADSMGVTVGRRQITQDGVPYTLLAVFPRSFYKAELIGNFTMGVTGAHKGFKDARDEILRFLRAYVKDQGVTGNVKVWIAGHSRAAAVSALVAGFLADEGSAYLGQGIALSPTDVYAYCTATPAHIAGGASRDEVLSVGAARTGPAYRDYDTPGAAYVHTGGGTIDPGAFPYKGIRNYILDTDFVPQIPPAAWGMQRLGVELRVGGGAATIDDMAKALSQISPDDYATFQAGADPRRFAWVSLDPMRIDLDNPVLDASVMRPTPEQGDGTIPTMFARRIDGLVSAVPTRNAYVSEGYQALLQTLARVHVTTGLPVLVKTTSRPGSRELLMSVLFGHLAYARERLGATSDAEAAQVVLMQLIAYLSSQDATRLSGEIQTIDDLVVFLARLIDENAQSPLVDSLLRRAAKSLAKNSNAELIVTVLSLFHPQGTGEAHLVGQSEPGPAQVDEEQLTQVLALVLASLHDALIPGVSAAPASVAPVAPLALVANSETTPQASAQETIKVYLLDVIRACHKGADPTSTLAGMTDKEVRGLLYDALSLLADNAGMEGLDTLIDEGRGKITTVIEALLPLLMRHTTAAGVPQTYASFTEAADGYFRLAVGGIFAGNPEIAQALSNEGPKFHTFLNNTLFTVAGRPYDLRYNVCILSTLVSQFNTLALSHHFEYYAAWAKATNEREEATHGSAHQQPTPAPTPVPTDSTRPGQNTVPVPAYSRGSVPLYTGSSYTGSSSGSSSSRTDSSTGAVTDKQAAPHTRLGGADRYETAAMISAAAFDRSEVAIVATGAGYADALAAAGLAGAKAAPIVLTDGNALSAPARRELARLGCTRVVVVGGDAAVSEAVAAELAAMGIAVERVAGASRAETSLQAMAAMGGTPERVVVASGASFADALAIGSWCYATRTPILLTNASGLLDATAVEAIRQSASLREAVVVGGTAAVGDVESQLAGIVPTTRIAGRNRFETSARVAEWAQAHGLSWETVAIASGASFPDALAGSALAGTKGAVTLLCSAGSGDAASTLSAHAADVQDLLVLGGTAAVPDSLAAELARAAA